MAKIEDFGEKIGGARKDLYGLNRELRLGDIVDWSDIDRDKYITKKEVFPLPDYQKLYDQGMDREVLFFVKQVRDALPAKPSPVIRYSMADEEKQKAVRQAQEDYVQTVGRFYDKAIHLKSLTECADYLNNLKAENLPDKNCFSQKLYNVASIRDPYTLMQFRHQLEKKKFLYSDDEKALLDYDIFSYDGTNVEVTMDRKDEPILVIKQGGTRFYVYRNSPEILDLANWKENTYFVMDKATHTIVTMNEPNRSSAEASAIALHKQKDVTVREQKKRKKKLIPPQLEKVRPTQEDYREGRNITGDDMMEIFGFRAGEFGNWENESDRQTNLNMSYDSLKDLAKALNMSDQDVSLGGKLAIAYGARGVSGALAHFEPGTNVINLTKMRGAGSLAHEWGHALDYYIAQTTGKGEVFATDAWNGMSYMHDVMQTIKYKDGKRTEYYNNAVRLDERYSKAGQGYWQSDVELFARAFASYIHDKLSGPSDYLVGHSEIKVPILVKDEQQWIYTSPQGEERKAINQAMDEMIDAIKEHGLLHQGREKNVEAPKMTMDEYLGSQGVGFPTSGYVLDKVRFPNGISKRMHQQINDEFEKTEQEYADRRKEARREYQEKVDNGEIIPKTKEEINIERAQGDPNKESTQAARRLLVKRGIMTEEELSTNVKVWDKKWTKMTEANGNDIVQETENLSDQELFTQQVDDVLAGVANQYNALKVCDTPQLLIEVGCKQLPMLITQKHLRDSLKPLSKSNSKWHGLTEQQIKKLPELIADPVMIYDSQTLKNSLVVVTSEIDSRNFPIIVSLKANGQGTYELQKIDSNFITSVYGRRNFAGHITDVVNKGDLLYWNKQKSQELFRVSRLQLPGCLNNLNFDIILHQSKSIVNTQLVEATVKQKKYAQQIAQALHVDLPQSNTKQAYQDFIKEHVEEYNQNRSVPVHYTDEQIARANAVDIVEYARSQGLELKRAGRDYRVSNYSGGFLITPEKNNWNWFAENKGGGVVQLCMELENKTWQDAIGTLIQEDMVAIQRSDLQNREPERPKEFHLPDHNNTTKHVYAYLTKTRKIDADIVKQMFGRKLLYENTQCSCVFVGYDKDGIPRHASVRSTNTTGNVYKKDVSGSQKKYSFSVTGKTNVLNVFKAPIDALSYMTLQKMNGRMPQDSYVALGGVSMTALDQYVKDHPDIRAIRICTDNDEAGQRAAEHIAEKYSDHYKVTRHTPKTKDFNEDLIAANENVQMAGTAENKTAFYDICSEGNLMIDAERRAIDEKFNNEQGKWHDTLREFCDGNISRNKLIEVGKTSNILVYSNAQEVPVYIGYSALENAMADIHDNSSRRHTHGHGLKIEDLDRIPEYMRSPLMVFQEDKIGTTSLTVITDGKDEQGRSIVITLALDKKNYRMEINKITTIFPADNIRQYVTDKLNRHKLIALNKKANGLISSKGNSLKGQFISFNDSIAYAKNVVNLNKLREMPDEEIAKLGISIIHDIILDPNADKYSSFVEQHRQLIQNKKEQYQNRTTVVINAFGGAGAGKTVACMDVCQQLKKKGYNAEYVSEYCKELVYEDSDMLSGIPDNQFEILKEQMRRMDRMIGQVDFIVTDSPILLNSVYNKALTPEYEQMVQELFRDYDNFTFFVERDTSHYQTEGRIHTLAESMEKDKQIKQMLHDNDIYFGTYNHETIDKIVDNASKTFKRLQERDQQISKYVDQEVAVTREKDVQSLSIEEKILYLSVLDTVYEQDYWKMIEDDIGNLMESEKTAYKNEYNQKKDECRLDKALVPKIGIAVVLEDGTYALQDVKVVDERMAEMIKENPTQVDAQKMSVNGKMGDLLLLKDSILEPYELYKISEDGLIKMDVGTEDQRSVEQCRKNISEQMLSSSFDVSVEQRCVKPLLENGVTLSSEIQQHYQKITRYFESRKPAKENLAAPEKKKGITFQLK